MNLTNGQMKDIATCAIADTIIVPTDTIVSVVTIVLIHLLIYLIQEHMYKLPVSPPVHLVSDQRTCQHK